MENQASKIKPAERLASVSEYYFSKKLKEVAQMNAEGKDVISLGIGSIMNARRILLLATGADKAEAIRAAVYGDINPRTQASILRTHPNVIFLLDKAAAGLL